MLDRIAAIRPHSRMSHGDSQLSTEGALILKRRVRNLRDIIVVEEARNPQNVVYLARLRKNLEVAEGKLRKF